MVQALAKGKILQFLVFLLVLFIMSKGCTKGLEAITGRSHRFGIKLYKLLREEPGNIIFSPTSLEVVLALVQMGARGDTAKEILAGLELPADTNIVKAGYNAIMKSLRSTDEMILEIANKIYSEKSFSVEEEFKLVAEKSFLATAENVDFVRNSEGSRVAMNSWVEKQTNDKIQNLFQPGDITPETKMVLINAVYFKGKWKYPFNPERTNKEIFHISSSIRKEVDMMHLKAKFGYAELKDLKAKMLVMPYVGEIMFMVILLPDEIDGLPEMEKKLNTVNIVELMKRVDHIDVDVSLPRFKIEKTMDLQDTLKKLGITSMFDPYSADFSGLSKEKGLYVSKVVQKAFIEVNEEGSEAAAATVSQIRVKRAAVWIQEFTVDRPFFVHLCNGNGATVFGGRVVEIDEGQKHSLSAILGMSQQPKKPHTEF